MRRFLVIALTAFLAAPALAQQASTGGAGGGSGMAGPIVAGCGLSGGTITSSGTISAAGTVVTFGDASPTIAATTTEEDVAVGTTFTANRTVTLPAASAVSSNCPITIKDAAGTIGTFTLTVQRAGSDSIDGATSVLLYAANSAITLRSDNVSRFKVIDSYGLPQLASGQIYVGSSSNLAQPVTPSGDCTLSNAGVLTCTKTSGMAFGALATLGAGTGLGSSGGNLNLGSIAADSVLANASGSSAAPGAVALPSCSSGSSALTYNTATHAVGCNTISGSGTVNSGTQYQIGEYTGAGTTTAVGGVSVPNCPDTGGNHVNFNNGTGVFTCGTSGGGGGSPGGSTNAVQTNAGSGAFGGVALTTGQIVVGTSGAPAASAFPYVEAWLTSGTTWTSPSWVTANTNIFVEMLGGGGGGSGCNTASDFSPGGAAGADLVLTGAGLIAASTGYTYAIGAAGTAGAATPTAGGNGGDTTLVIGATTYTAHGGTGSSACGNGAAASAGGTAVNGTLNIPGAPGWYTASGKISVGGSTKYGAGGIEPNASAAQNATGFGSGGWGGTGTGAVGSAGTAGVIHIVAAGT